MEKYAVILNNISDAADFFKKGFLGNNKIIFSTYPGVNLYLKKEYATDSYCLSELFDSQEALRLKNEVSSSVEKIVKLLDAEISPRLNEQARLEMKQYFSCLYGYTGKFHFAGYVFLIKAIEKIKEKYNINRFYLYNYRFDTFLKTTTDLVYIIHHFFPEIEIKVLAGNDKNRFIDLLNRNISLGSLRKLIKDKYVKISEQRSKANSRHPSAVTKTIFLNNYLHDLFFLKEKLKEHRTIYFDDNRGILLGLPVSKSRIELDLNVAIQQINAFINNCTEIEKVLLKDIKDDFIKNKDNFFATLHTLDSLHRKTPIQLGIWGMPPISGSMSLVYEYLRSKGVKIIGAQHGCLYGDSFEPWHFDLDFNRCDYYISYGFNNPDLKRLYPDIKHDLKILPLGSKEPLRTIKGKRKIDFLFPVTNGLNIFRGGMLRLLPHELMERQVQIIKFLDSLPDCSSYLKPFRGSNHQNFPVFSLLKELKYVKYNDKFSLNEFLGYFEPRAVIIELPSQPLFDVLHLDSEIFLMGSSIQPYETEALEELKKRVYYTNNLNELFLWLNLFVKGQLSPRRNPDFYNHYVYKEKREEKITALIKELIGETNGRKNEFI